MMSLHAWASRLNNKCKIAFEIGKADNNDFEEYKKVRNELKKVELEIKAIECDLQASTTGSPTETGSHTESNDGTITTES